MHGGEKVLARTVFSAARVTIMAWWMGTFHAAGRVVLFCGWNTTWAPAASARMRRWVLHAAQLPLQEYNCPITKQTKLNGGAFLHSLKPHSCRRKDTCVILCSNYFCFVLHFRKKYR